MGINRQCFLYVLSQVHRPCGGSFSFPSFLPSFSPFLRSLFLFKWEQLNKACGIVRIRGWAYLMLILSVPSVLPFLMQQNMLALPNWFWEVASTIFWRNKTFLIWASSQMYLVPPLSFIFFSLNTIFYLPPPPPAPPLSLTGDGILDLT